MHIIILVNAAPARQFDALDERQRARRGRSVKTFVASCCHVAWGKIAHSMCVLDFILIEYCIHSFQFMVHKIHFHFFMCFLQQ